MRAREDIGEMLSEFKGWIGDRKLENSNKRQNQASKHALNEQRVEESKARVKETEERRNYQVRQNKIADIALLREQVTIGLIIEDDFKEQSRRVFGL